VKASIARWRSQLGDAAALVETRARTTLPQVTTENSTGRLVHAKVAVWAGLIAKDSGNLEGALQEFGSVQTDDELIRARIAFQIGDVQMQLGCFDAALQALNEAVMLSHRSEAPVQEQARYLARRGTLHRKRDELQRAAEDFQAALVVLENATETLTLKELGFERAKIEDERVLNLLALGRFEEAAFVLQGNLMAFRAYQDEHRVDATFRLLRNTLRLGLTYWCRGLNQPYRLPFGQPAQDFRHPDLTHAAKLMQRILHDVQDPAEGRKRFGSLYWRSLLVLSMVSPQADEAVRYAQAALAETRFAYPQAISRAYLAAALLRRGAVAEVLEQLQQAKVLLARARQTSHAKEQGDRGLLTWLTTLELRTLIMKGDVQHAGDRLVQALDTPSLRPYHEAVLRAYGDAVESSLELGWLEHSGVRHYLQLDGNLPDQSVRLPDALVSHWLRLRMSHLNPAG
jgi:tetratricopeptide (TPR) repeat protein